MIEREDSLSQLRQQIDALTCDGCRENKQICTDCCRDDGSVIGPHHHLGHGHVDDDEIFDCTAQSNALIPLVASIVKAAFEACADEAARSVHDARCNGWLDPATHSSFYTDRCDCATGILVRNIRALTPESAILGAQIAELEALAREVEIIRKNWNIDESIRRFDTWIKARKLTYESQLSALKAKLATPQPKAADHPNR